MRVVEFISKRRIASQSDCNRSAGLTCQTVIPSDPDFVGGGEESSMGILKRWLGGNPCNIPPLIHPDPVGPYSVGMTSRPVCTVAWQTATANFRCLALMNIEEYSDT